MKTVPAKKKRGRKPNGTPTMQALSLRKGGTNGSQSHKEATTSAEMLERKQKVWDLYVKQRMTMMQIAKAVGVSNATVCRDINEVAEALHRATLQTAAEWRQVELERIEQMDRVLIPLLYGDVPGKVVPKRVNGKMTAVREAPDPMDVVYVQLHAHRQLQKSLELQAKLVGSFAPVKVAPTTPDGLRPYQQMTEEELMAKIREREQLLGLKPVIDVHNVAQA